MKSAWKDLKKYTATFKRNWLAYFLLLLSLDLFNQIVVIPLFRYFTTYILQASAIPFVSYQNLITIITTHTLMFGVLIVELIVLLIIIYLQFAFLLLAVRAINNSNFHLKSIFSETFQSLRKIRVGSLLLLMIYFLLVVPFADIIFRTPLLTKIQVPQFILDYMTRTPLLLTLLISFYVIIIFLGIRLIYTLPIMIFKQEKTFLAMKKSWNLTKKGSWIPIIGRLIILAITTGVVVAAFYTLIYVLQLGCDLLPGKYFSLTMAIINLSLIQIFSEIILVYSTLVSLFILLAALKLEKDSIANRSTKKRHFSKTIITFTSLAALIIVAGSVTTNIFYLIGVNSTRPLVISHRGVDNKNGVQNTIQALRKTAKEKPDFVEIDLHETKDKQFVVLHDENLKKLTGVNKAPKELTLKQITKLTAKEDGHQSKIVGFDQYLTEAQKLKQKLLIEIKTTPNDTKTMLARFNRKYGKIILENKYQVQSLDYKVIEELHQINPKLFVLYIQPYNFTYPQSVADGYSMEYSTLNSDFIWQAHLQNHPVYAWTINDAALMKKMMYEQVDGLITDRVGLAKKTIKKFQKDYSYANRILNYVIVVHKPHSFEV